MILFAYDADGVPLLEKTYYSLGGGFVVDEDAVGADRIKLADTVLAHPFRTGDELLRLSRETGLSISALMEGKGAAAVLVDTFPRVATDLRVPLTDRCNRPDARPRLCHASLLRHLRPHPAHRGRPRARLPDGSVVVLGDLASALLRGGDVDQGVYVSRHFASAAQTKPNTMGKERAATVAASLPDSAQELAVHLRQFAS
jgi:hypothetical protein